MKLDCVKSDNEMYPKAAIGLAVSESFSSRETCHVSGIEFHLGFFNKGNTVALHAMKAYGKKFWSFLDSALVPRPGRSVSKELSLIPIE